MRNTTTVNELLTELQSIDGSTIKGNKKRTELLVRISALKSQK